MSPTKQTKVKTAPKNKFSVDNWIGIGNLALIVISGIFVTIYLQNQNQKFQTELQERDAKIQQQMLDLQEQSKLAKITVEYNNSQYLKSDFAIRNDGTAVAENLNIVICLNEIDYSWKSEISSTDDFVFRFQNPAILARQTYVNKPDCGFSTTANNAVEIFLGALAPKQSIFMTVEFKTQPPLQNSSLGTTTSIKIPNATLEKVQLPLDDWGKTQVYIWQIIFDFLTEKYAVAKFGVSVYCTNCTFNYYPDKPLCISPLGFLYFNDADVVKGDEFVNYTFLNNTPVVLLDNQQSPNKNSQIYLELIDYQSDPTLSQIFGTLPPKIIELTKDEFDRLP